MRRVGAATRTLPPQAVPLSLAGEAKGHEQVLDALRISREPLLKERRDAQKCANHLMLLLGKWHSFAVTEGVACVYKFL